MDIPGIGVDIVDCERIRGILRRSGRGVRQRVFTPAEAAYCDRMADPAPHFAARFAAKEAVVKALGTGLRRGMSWRDIEVVRDAQGCPRIVLHGAAREAAKAVGVDQVDVSLSHTCDHAVAMVRLRFRPIDA